MNQRQLIINWWLSRKPLAWTIEEFVCNPTCNISSDADRRLAEYAATLVHADSVLPCDVPDGFRLVPIMPTPEMVDAADLGWVIRDAERRKRLKVYRAMIDAATNSSAANAAILLPTKREESS